MLRNNKFNLRHKIVPGSYQAWFHVGFSLTLIGIHSHADPDDLAHHMTFLYGILLLKNLLVSGIEL
jgi:hypothetical protein